MRKDRPQEPIKIISQRGGKVHVANDYLFSECGDLVPMCRTMGQNTRRTRYLRVDAPATCERCQPPPAREKQNQADAKPECRV
jgi:hypothetical protein